MGEEEGDHPFRAEGADQEAEEEVDHLKMVQSRLVGHFADTHRLTANRFNHSYVQPS